MPRISLVEQYQNKDVITQIYDLKDSVDGFDQSIQEASAKADTAYNKADSVEGTASNALTTAKTADSKATQAQTDATLALQQAEDAQTDADRAVATASIVTTNASGTLVMTQVNNASISTDIPMASETQSGLMNAQTFKTLGQLNDRISALENTSAVAFVTFPSDSPTQSEITTAFTNVAGRAPVKGDQATDINKGITYQYDGSTWILTKASSSPWSNTTAGIVKGTPSTGPAGTIFAETDGTGSVNGWDALVAKADNATSVANQATQIANTVSTNLQTTNSNVSNNTADITSLKGRTSTLETTVQTIPKIQQATVVLNVASWSSLSQTVSCSIVKENNIVWVAPASSVPEYGSAGIYASAQGNGTITFKCTTLPTIAFTVNIVSCE